MQTIVLIISLKEIKQISSFSRYGCCQQTRWNFIQPIIDFGGGGLGKTHLAHAIGVKLKINIQKTVLYISAEIFTQQYIR
jgi:chromosomal replication initiation ATPase DnaA